MTAEDAQDFALKFMRLARPDPLVCVQSWAAPWKVAISRFKSSKAEHGFHFNYLIAFSVLVPKSRLDFLLDDLRSTIYTRLDAAWIKARVYDYGDFVDMCVDAQIPNHDEYDHSFRRLP
jgi:hypothetical protein